MEAAAPELSSPGRLAAPAWTEAIVRSFSFWRMRIGFTVVVLIILIAVIGPFVAPHAPGDIIARPYQHPSAGLPLGADYLGEDVLSRVSGAGAPWCGCRLRRRRSRSSAAEPSAWPRATAARGSTTP